MKICEYHFRQLYHHVIYIYGDALNQTLKKMNLLLPNGNGILAYGYVDYEQGLMFELLGLQVGSDENVEYRIAPKQITCKFAKKNIEEWPATLLPVQDPTVFLEKIQYIQDTYEQDPTIQQLREFTDLDASRHSEYPDDVMVFLLKEGKEPEAVWVRCEYFEEDKIYGTILNEPLEDFGVHEKDSISFQLTQLEDEKLTCVHVI